ncbi:MAG TPA: ABC transporter permease [Oligoflexia bacterium]|nr:ABC transporter permease [Oligoflexia bacterium]
MTEFLFTVASVSTPLVYAALGGMLSERAGVVNIALEGLMLAGAFTAATVAWATKDPWLAFVAGVLASSVFGALHALLTITFRAHAIISGLAVNAVVAGLTPVLCKTLFDSSTSSPMLENAQRITALGGRVSPLVICAPIVALLLYVMHRWSRFGQYIRFAGEVPDALDAQGISSQKVRWLAVCLSGALCGVAGAYLSIDHGAGFTRNMTAGRGYVALAAVIVGRWTPQGALAGALIFGSIEACQILFQDIPLWGDRTLPVQWMQSLPFIATLLVLAVVNRRAAKSPGGLFVPKALSS